MIGSRRRARMELLAGFLFVVFTGVFFDVALPALVTYLIGGRP